MLVNNAGIERRGSVEELALGEFRAVMETNYFRGAPLYAGGAPEHADQIRDIIESDSPQFRYPVGPDAEPFLAWRASMTDEQWVDWAATDDESWYAAVERDFGLDARKSE